MRSSAWFALALAAPLALSAGRAHAEPPPDPAAAYASTAPPLGWRDPSVGKETRSSAMVAVGITLIAVSATMLPIGTVLAVNTDGQNCISDPTGQNFACVPSREPLSGIGVLAAAAGGIAIGIPLVVLGSQKIPIEIPRRAALRLGPSSVALRFDF